MNRAATSKYSFRQEVVHRCLTERCQDCSGLYHSDALRLEILCHCACHHHSPQEREYKDSNTVDKPSHVGKTEHYLARPDEPVIAAAGRVSSDGTVNATSEGIQNIEHEVNQLVEANSAC